MSIASNKVLKIRKVRQANEFIESPYAVELTIHEIKIIEYLIADCKEEDYELIGKKQGKEYSYNATQLAKILNTSLSRVVIDGDKLANNITQKRIIHKTFNSKKEIEEFLYLPIIISAEYKSGIFKFELNYKILPFFININKNFTEYQLHYLLSLRSSYSIKIYKLLYQYRNIKSRVFKVDDLKGQCGLIDKYPQYKNFKQSILVPSVAQINELTDLYVSFNEIKLGRSVDKIEFSFKLQNKPIHSDFIDKKTLIIDVKPVATVENSKFSEIDKLLLGIESELSDKTKKIIIKFYKEKGVEFLEASIKYTTKHAKSNLDKYLYDTLVNGWAEVELQKILDKKAKQQKQLQIAKQKQQESNAKLQAKEQKKLIIAVEWNNLTNEQQEKYIKYATNLINKYNQKLNIFPTIVEDLPICCYAVSQNKSFNLSIEGFFKTLLNETLHVI